MLQTMVAALPQAFRLPTNGSLRSGLERRAQAHDPGPVAGIEGRLSLPLDVDDDPDLDDGLDGGTRGRKHLEAQVVQAGLGLLTDTGELVRGRNVALDDAERPAPHLPHLGLVPLAITRENGVDDDRAEFSLGRLKVGNP